jgi:alanyl-tRNA synthetase
LSKTEELRKDGASKERDLRGELSKILSGSVIDRLEVDKGVVWVKRIEKATHDFDFLGLIVGGFQTGTAEAESKVQGGKLAESVLVITSAVVGTPTLLLVYSASNDVAKGVNERIKGVLDEGEGGKGRVKGGGARGRYMSKIEGKWSKEDGEKVQSVLEEVR